MEDDDEKLNESDENDKKKTNVIKERGIREKEESVLKETGKKETEKFERVRHKRE